MKKILIGVVVLAVLAVGTTVAFAAGVVQTPAEIVSDLTGKPVEDVTQAFADGDTYAEQAAGAGLLDEFKDTRLEQYKLALDDAVSEGRITQERADELYAAMEARMEANMEDCAGDGTGAYGPGTGAAGFGTGAGNRAENGNAAGQGAGIGGRGAGGACLIAG